MKKILYLIALALTLPACQATWLDESEHPMPDGVGKKPEFVFDGTSEIRVGKLGGDFTSKVRANQPWLVESTEDWIVVTSGRIGKGDGAEETVTSSHTCRILPLPSFQPVMYLCGSAEVTG